MPDSAPPDLPVGDLQLYDDYRPALSPGPWRIELAHTVAGVPTGPLGATQQFVVSAPQFAIDQSAVVTRYPPDGGTGDYGTALPHVLLADALLPWERTVSGSAAQPWLALLVLRDDEVLGGTDSPTRSIPATVGTLLAPDPAVRKPAVTPGVEVADTDPCAYIQLPTSVFTAVTPRLDELGHLAHCRRSNIADKADQGLDPDGLFSVVVANRFPSVPDGATGPVRFVAHLVSLEGFADVLVDEPSFGSATSVAVVSLASWAFTTAPRQQEDFRGLVGQLVGQEYDGTTWHPENLWLRLPAPDPPLDTGTVAGAEAAQRLADGFVPLPYRLRTGEQTFAWYRGPLTPVVPAPLDPPGPFLTSDSALIYQSRFGVLDASLATAWQAGRALALADRGFGQALYAFRRRGHTLTDTLLERLRSDAFSATQIADLSSDTSVQNEFLAILDAELLTALGTPTPDPTPSAPPTPPPDPDPVTAVRSFLADPVTQQTIIDLVRTELAPVATWLARLLLLYPVPFNLLVPDDRMLAPETLRFCYLDQNWLRALFDGATSIGIESSRDTFYHQTMHGLVYAAAQEAALLMRDQRTGVAQPADAVTDSAVSGFLLRSALVAAWPNLAVRGTTADGTPLRIVRMDHLAPNLLLCLFQGVPDVVELSEPREGLRFGVDDDGLVALRQPTAGGATQLGTQLGTTFPALSTCLRPGGNGVLDIAPSAATGLVRRIQGALAAAGAPLPILGPADLALQLGKAPEAVQFTTQAS
jgi:hypothetical protein